MTRRVLIAIALIVSALIFWAYTHPMGTGAGTSRRCRGNQCVLPR